MKFSLTALLMVPTFALAELPVISDAHIVQPPPGTPVAGGFFTISNPDDEALVITGVSSADVARVELHLSAVVDDVATMEEQEEIVIPAGTALEFKRGSYHVMFIGLETQLAPGDEIEITIESNTGPIEVNLPVVAPGTAPGHHGSDQASTHESAVQHSDDSPGQSH